MNASDWIQLGILIANLLVILGGGLIALLRLSKVIVDIEDRQRRIDIEGDKWKQVVSDTDIKWRDMNWKNSIALTALGLVVGALLIIDRLDHKGNRD